MKFTQTVPTVYFIPCDGDEGTGCFARAELEDCPTASFISPRIVASGISRSCSVLRIVRVSSKTPPRLACHPWTIYNTRSGRGRGGRRGRRVSSTSGHFNRRPRGRLYPGEMPTDRSNLTSCHNFFIPPTFHFYPPLSPHFSLFLIRTILSPVHSILFVQKSNCQVWGGSRRDE